LHPVNNEEITDLFGRARWEPGVVVMPGTALKPRRRPRIAAIEASPLVRRRRPVFAETPSERTPGPARRYFGRPVK